MSFFSYTLLGDNMLIFLKGFVVGIGKIIPGVSGAILAINFNVYEKAINSITNFFNDWKSNLLFIIKFGGGIFLSIILCSGLLLFLLTNYKFLTMMFFIGLIIGGTYNFSKSVIINKKNIILISIIVIALTIISLHSIHNNYVLKNNYIDYFIFFIAGIVEIFTSIVPGISGTSIMIMIGIYNEVLKLSASILNLNYIINHFDIYLSYGIGMFISFIINTYLIKYLFNNHRAITNTCILGLSLSSILFLIITTFNNKFTIIEFILGIMLFVIGLLLSCIFDK